MSADGSIRLPLSGKTIRAADLFCGAGGTSTGARRAIQELGGKMQLTAVNHWTVAIETHTRMHPDATHLCADMESVRPRQAVPDGVLDLLMASPTCTYFSRARGGRPVHDQQRMDPWHVVRWCTELRVHRLLVENVPEMVEWGPCSIVTGRPIPSRKGEYFRAWLDALKAIGFRLDWRVLCCADYGDPTTRERFFLIARSDRKALRWPEPSHIKGGSTDLFGSRAPWRAAAEIIDWSRSGKSIFGRKKPLKPNTLRRILAGAKRNAWPQPYLDALQALLDGREPVLDLQLVDGVWTVPGNPDPMLVQLRGTSPEQIGASARGLHQPVGTISAGGVHHALVMAIGSGGAARDIGQPVPTITGGGNGARPHFIEPLLMGVSSNAAAHPVSNPAPTITTGGGSSQKRPGNARPQLIEPIIMRGNVGLGRTGDMRGTSQPMPTVTCSESLALAQPLLSPYYGGGSGLTSQPVTEPVPAVTTKARFGLAEPVLMRAGHGDAGHTVGGRVLDSGSPLPTVTGSNEISVAQPLIVPLSNSSSPGVPRSTGLPLATITTAKGGDKALAQPFVIRAGHGGDALKRPASHVIDIGRPLPTVTSRGDYGLSEPFIVPNFGEAPGQAPRTHAITDPLPAVTSHGAGALAVPTVQGCRIDIHYRMLHWRELAGAMSFDDAGEVYDFAGTGTEITKQIGNAVPGRTAKALVRALVEG